MRCIRSWIIPYKNFFKYLWYIFRGTWTYDFRLLKLEKSIFFNDKMSPICLPPHNHNPAGSNCWLAGWGRIQAQPRMYAKVLQETDTQGKSNSFKIQGGVLPVQYQQPNIAGPILPKLPISPKKTYAISRSSAKFLSVPITEWGNIAEIAWTLEVFITNYFECVMSDVIF